MGGGGGGGDRFEADRRRAYGTEVYKRPTAFG